MDTFASIAELNLPVMIDYTSLFQNFINNQSSYLVYFLKCAHNLSYIKNLKETNLKAKKLVEETYRKDITFYINSLDDNQIAAFESGSEYQSLQNKKTFLASLLKIAQWSLLMSVVLFPPLRSRPPAWNRPFVNFKNDQALMVPREVIIKVGKEVD